MLRPYHIEIMHLALADTFGSRALEKVIHANLRQDWIPGQIGHPEYHFDHNAFDRSYAYMEAQRAQTISALMANDIPAAWSAFGKLTHTAQDFYAHSNYIQLWLARQADTASLSPSDVTPMDPDLIHSRLLRSGRVYWLEIFTIFPSLRPLVMPFLPHDSHGWMNLDAPERGPRFPYAFEAAVKRTKIEFKTTTRDLPEDLVRRFVDK